jgi:hypothetical protein
MKYIVVALLLLLLLLLVAIGIYFVYKKNQKSEDEKEWEEFLEGSDERDVLVEKANDIATTSGVHLFSECKYEGITVHKTIDDDDDEILQLVLSSPGFRSFVITDGYKVELYYTEDFTGSKLSFSGPVNVNCPTSKSIKSVKIFREYR